MLTHKEKAAPYPYREVHVLLLLWDEDALGVYHSTKVLERLFRDDCNFTTVQIVHIPWETHTMHSRPFFKLGHPVFDKGEPFDFLLQWKSQPRQHTASKIVCLSKVS
jgi:hypothetical protein